LRTAFLSLGQERNQRAIRCAARAAGQAFGIARVVGMNLMLRGNNESAGLDH
jgi:hypothetical protein